MDPLSLRPIALAVAQEHSVAVVLSRIVDGLCEQPAVALARIWLTGLGDICEDMPDAPRVPRPHALPAPRRQRRQPRTARERGGTPPRRVPPLPARRAQGRPHRGQRRAAALGDAAQTTSGSRVPNGCERGHPQLRGPAARVPRRGDGVLAVFGRAHRRRPPSTGCACSPTTPPSRIANARALGSRAAEARRSSGERLPAEEVARAAHGDIVGQSPALQRCCEQIEMVAPTDATVLILGESGTGKELIARADPRTQRRARRAAGRASTAPPSRASCSRASSSATRGRLHRRAARPRGRFELADGGTLFLDEVGEIPLELQAKLLRVLQEGEFERVGESAPARVDVRVIAATNRDLQRRGRARALPRGPVLPPRTSSRSRCRRCASAARTSRRSPRTSSAAARRLGRPRPALDGADCARSTLRLAGQRARTAERDRARGHLPAAPTALEIGRHDPTCGRAGHSRRPRQPL